MTPHKISAHTDNLFSSFSFLCLIELKFCDVSAFFSEKQKSFYKDSPVSAVFWSPGNRTIWKTALIEDWFITKIASLDFWIFKVLFFCSFWTNKIILLGSYWQLFESIFTNHTFLTKFYATFSLDYYWSFDITFIV